jgi:hypothetical protein
MSLYQEPAYGSTSAIDDNLLTQMFEQNEPGILQPSWEWFTDQEFIKGHEFMEDQNKRTLVAQDMSIPFNFPSSLESIGLLYSLAMGTAVTSTGVGYNEHVSKLLAACTTENLPSTKWMLGLSGTTETYMRVKGVVLNEIRLVMDAHGWLTVSGTAYSDGDATNVPGFTFPAAFTTSDFVTGTQCGFVSADYGSTFTNHNSVLRGFDFGINNNHDLADARSNIAAASTLLSDPRFGNRDFTCTVTVQGHQGDEFWDDAMAGTTKVMQISATKNANKLITVLFPKCTIQNVTPGFDGLRDTLELEYGMYFSTSESSPIVVTVRNDSTGYLLTT